MLAKQYPLQFLNIPGIYSIIRIALSIEYIGIVKSVFLLFSILEKMFFIDSYEKYKRIKKYNKPQKTIELKEQISFFVENEETKTNESYKKPLKPTYLSTFCYYFCYTYSTLLTLSCFIFVVYCLGRNYGIQIVPSSKVGNVASIIGNLGIFIFCLVVVFYCEGLKIAVIQTSSLYGSKYKESLIMESEAFLEYDNEIGGLNEEMSEEREVRRGFRDPFWEDGYLKAGKIFYLLHEIPKKEKKENESNDKKLVDNRNKNIEIGKGNEDKVKQFLLGRQLIVVPLNFLVAQLTHFSGFPKNLLPDYVYFPVIVAGIPGVLLLLQFAQLAPQLLAETHSMKFMNLRGSFSLVYIALCIENVGITEFAWVLYNVVSFFCCKMISVVSVDEV